MAFAGRLAIITGSGSGIGRSASRILAKEGATVVVIDRNIKAAEETVSLIGGHYIFPYLESKLRLRDVCITT